MRTIFAGLGSEYVELARAASVRAASLATLRFSQCENARVAAIKTSVWAGNLRVRGENFDDVRARAALEPFDDPSRKLVPHALAPVEPPEARMERFLSRRGRKDWARILRAKFGGPIFGDTLFLALLRRSEPELAARALDFALLCSALCLDLDGASAALALGADPLRKAYPPVSINFLDVVPKKIIAGNMLWAILHSEPSRPLTGSLLGASPGDVSFNVESDSLAECSLSIALASCPSGSLEAMLSLLPLGCGDSRPEGWRDAMGAAMNSGLPRCARLLFEMGMDPLASSRKSPVTRPNRLHPQTEHAWRALDSEAEARAISATLTPSHAVRPARARL